MKKTPAKPLGFKDLFSGQAGDYARFRPTYPDSLFSFLTGLVSVHDVAWDCGTGNGQAALKLAEHFARVFATDPSKEQLRQAGPHPKIEYRMAPAEQSGLTAHSVDLITVAQAFHWFKADAFFAEVSRVAKPGAVLALWSYNLAEVSPEVDRVVLKLYRDILGPHWEPERRLVEDGYRSVQAPFAEMDVPEFEMTAEWSLHDLVGYLGTWSALKTFEKKTGANPLVALSEELAAAWGDVARRRIVRWPLAVRTWRVSS